MIEVGEKQIKNAKIKFTFASICFVLAFAAIIMSAVLDDGTYEFLCPIGLILFFTFMIISLVLLFSGFPDFAAYDIWKLQNKYKEKMLTNIYFENKESVMSIFEKSGFKYVDANYWIKKKFHFLKDTIRYYVRFAELQPNKYNKNITEDSFSKIVEKEINLFAKEDYKDQKSVVFLFIEFNKLNQEELKDIKKVCESYLTVETLYLSCIQGGLVPIVVDKKNKKMYFFDESKGITYYAYGCRMFKKIFCK